MRHAVGVVAADVGGDLVESAPVELLTVRLATHLCEATADLIVGAARFGIAGQLANQAGAIHRRVDVRLLQRGQSAWPLRGSRRLLGWSPRLLGRLCGRGRGAWSG